LWFFFCWNFFVTLFLRKITEALPCRVKAGNYAKTTVREFRLVHFLLANIPPPPKTMFFRLSGFAIHPYEVFSPVISGRTDSIMIV